jgi:hypothetical protein
MVRDVLEEAYLDRRTGPISTTGVNSKTFSIGALVESSEGGSKRVTLFSMAGGRVYENAYV